MDVAEAIRERKSVRAFKPDPVSQDMLKKIVGDSGNVISRPTCASWASSPSGLLPSSCSTVTDRPINCRCGPCSRSSVVLAEAPGLW